MSTVTNPLPLVVKITIMTILQTKIIATLRDRDTHFCMKDICFKAASRWERVMKIRQDLQPLVDHGRLTMTAAMSSGLSPSRSNLNVTILSLCVCSWHSTTRSTLSESCRDKRDQSQQASVCSPDQPAKLNTNGTKRFCVWAHTWKEQPTSQC